MRSLKEFALSPSSISSTFSTRKYSLKDIDLLTLPVFSSSAEVPGWVLNLGKLMRKTAINLINYNIKNGRGSPVL